MISELLYVTLTISLIVLVVAAVLCIVGLIVAMGFAAFGMGPLMCEVPQ